MGVRRTPPRAKEFDARLLVEVPRAALEDASTMAWDELVAMAESAGWRTRVADDWLWCAIDHALLREGIGAMQGIPVLHFQKW